MRVVGYFTNDRYKAYAEHMAESARAVGLECTLYPKEDRGDWKLNVGLKPGVVFRALVEHPSEDILYVDADAVFRSFPEAVKDCPKDIACHFYQGRPISAVLFVKNDAYGLQIVEEWLKEAVAHPDQHDDVVSLHNALERLGGSRALHLPPSYYYRQEFTARKFPGAIPVVEHFNIGEHTFPAIK